MFIIAAIRIVAVGKGKVGMEQYGGDEKRNEGQAAEKVDEEEADECHDFGESTPQFIEDLNWLELP